MPEGRLPDGHDDNARYGFEFRALERAGAAATK